MQETHKCAKSGRTGDRRTMPVRMPGEKFRMGKRDKQKPATLRMAGWRRPSGHPRGRRNSRDPRQLFAANQNRLFVDFLHYQDNDSPRWMRPESRAQGCSCQLFAMREYWKIDCSRVPRWTVKTRSPTGRGGRRGCTWGSDREGGDPGRKRPHGGKVPSSGAIVACAWGDPSASLGL